MSDICVALLAFLAVMDFHLHNLKHSAILFRHIKTNGLFRMAIHLPNDPDEALAGQIEMIRYLTEKENNEFLKYSDLID